MLQLLLRASAPSLRVAWDVYSGSRCGYHHGRWLAGADSPGVIGVAVVEGVGAIPVGVVAVEVAGEQAQLRLATAEGEGLGDGGLEPLRVDVTVFSLLSSK